MCIPDPHIRQKPESPVFTQKPHVFNPPHQQEKNRPIFVKKKEIEPLKFCESPRKVWTKGHCWIQCDEKNSTGFSIFHQSEKTFARHYALLWAILSLVAASAALFLSLCSPVSKIQNFVLEIIYPVQYGFEY